MSSSPDELFTGSTSDMFPNIVTNNNNKKTSVCEKQIKQEAHGLQRSQKSPCSFRNMWYFKSLGS